MAKLKPKGISNFFSHNKPTDFDKPVRIVRGEADMLNESAFSLNRNMVVPVCPIDLERERIEKALASEKVSNDNRRPDFYFENFFCGNNERMKRYPALKFQSIRINPVLLPYAPA